MVRLCEIYRVNPTNSLFTPYLVLDYARYLCLCLMLFLRAVGSVAL
jgi:hypothetical protein